MTYKQGALISKTDELLIIPMYCKKKRANGYMKTIRSYNISN